MTLKILQKRKRVEEISNYNNHCMGKLKSNYVCVIVTVIVIVYKSACNNITKTETKLGWF